MFVYPDRDISRFGWVSAGMLQNQRSQTRYCRARKSMMGICGGVKNPIHVGWRGVAQAGLSDYGTIANNWIIFNQSTNPTIPAHGGGLAILGASPDRTLPNGQECGNTGSDADCPPGLPGAGPLVATWRGSVFQCSAE